MLKENLINEIHWKTINDLLKKYDILFYGDIKSHGVVKNRTNRNLNRDINNIKFYKLGLGNEVEYDGFLVFDDVIKMLIEYKSYTEVSMLKRVFVDAQIGKKFLPNIKYSLCMLESAFGHNDINISHSAITLIDHLQKTLDVEMNFFILMKGNRKSSEDIGKKEFIKYININELRFTIEQFTIFFNSFKKS
jgi:hypothetical protein